MDKQVAKNLVEEMQKRLGDCERAEEALHAANVAKQVWIGETVQALYDNGYNSRDDVAMLLAFAAHDDTDEILALLAAEIEG